MEELKVGDEVLIKSRDQYNGKTGIITKCTLNAVFDFTLKVGEKGDVGFDRHELTKITKTNHDKTQISLGITENPLVNLLLEQYIDGDNYVIPKKLLKQLISLKEKEGVL